MIKAIFWDNDGVLVDTERLYFIATQRVLGGVGVSLSQEQYIDLLLVQGKPPWYLAAEKGATPEDIEKLRDERNTLYGFLLEQENIIVDDAGDVLEKLWNRYMMGIVTSSRSDHFEIIHKRTGFLKYFQFALTSDLYSHTKPHPEPYLLALERSGFSADECIVIEDSERGLTAAKAAGIRCIVIPNEFTRRSNFAGAYKVMESVRDLLLEL
jgi:HAD superfamily hydrolase (TIGR01509 family)